jgi:hypothetical protein
MFVASAKQIDEFILFIDSETIAPSVDVSIRSRLSVCVGRGLYDSEGDLLLGHHEYFIVENKS